MASAIISLILLLLFSELASANFKRLAPVLEAWEQSKAQQGESSSDLNPFPWLGGWEKLAAFVWALGASIPLLAFALACHLFIKDPASAGNLIIGSMVGTNVIGLSLAFGFVLLSGKLTFFRVRTVTSPVFLLIATVIFTHVCLNQVITTGEALVLLLLMAGYVLYFRRFSSEWKHYERAFAERSLIESSEGVLPLLAIFCMGVGFFFLAVLVSYPFVHELERFSHIRSGDSLRLGAHFVSFALAIPWLLRSLMVSKEGSTSKAIKVTSISHACLLNVLFLPAMTAIFGMSGLSQRLTSIHLPALLLFTGIFVSTLLIEKEKGGKLPWILILSYLLYTGLGLFY